MSQNCEPFGGSDYCYYCGKDMCYSPGVSLECETRKPGPVTSYQKEFEDDWSQEDKDRFTAALSKMFKWSETI